MPQFIKGRELSRRFYGELVRPILEAHYPGLPHAAAHIGPGSDVLGFDTEMSSDHDWGPWVCLLLRDADAGLADEIRELMGRALPHEFLGYPTGRGDTGEDGTKHMVATGAGPVAHHVVIKTVRALIWELLAYDIDRPPDAIDWLTFPSQALRSIVAGAVHHDGVGELSALRERLAWYPRDVWLYLLAAGWERIGQEEHLMPRAGFVGDELGSAIMGSRLARDVMALGFLMERQYAPYPKWFGSAFRQLACAEALAPPLWRAQLAETWRERMAALGEAFVQLARLHNALGLTAPLPERLTSFFGRPFDVIWGGAFAQALRERIADPEVQRIAALPPIGGIDQWSDSTDLRSNPSWRPALRGLYAR